VTSANAFPCQPRLVKTDRGPIAGARRAKKAKWGFCWNTKLSGIHSTTQRPAAIALVFIFVPNAESLTAPTGQ
jgi:hypothetical protein